MARSKCLLSELQNRLNKNTKRISKIKFTKGNPIQFYIDLYSNDERDIIDIYRKAFLSIEPPLATCFTSYKPIIYTLLCKYFPTIFIEEGITFKGIVSQLEQLTTIQKDIMELMDNIVKLNSYLQRIELEYCHTLKSDLIEFEEFAPKLEPIRLGGECVKEGKWIKKDNRYIDIRIPLNKRFKRNLVLNEINKIIQDKSRDNIKESSVQTKSDRTHIDHALIRNWKSKIWNLPNKEIEILAKKYEIICRYTKYKKIHSDTKWGIVSKETGKSIEYLNRILYEKKLLKP